VGAATRIGDVASVVKPIGFAPVLARRILRLAAVSLAAIGRASAYGIYRTMEDTAGVA